ncbi:MAG TPA: hypothetical protein VF621_15590 [Pyrinomonadaceae bacterium]|jgi:hypothetical protein
MSDTEQQEAAQNSPAAEPRGINSIQLMHDGRRWRLLSIFWEAETPGTPIPEKYLESAP